MSEDCHIYLLPFRVVNNNIKVLLGKKLCYSEKDGWVHNNPGQYVIIGGGCGVDKRTRKAIQVSDQLNLLIESSTREFIEETGNRVYEDRIFVQRFKQHGNYAISFYRVDTDQEYNKFTKVSKETGHFAELDHAKWFSIEEAMTLFENNNQINQPCNNKDLNVIAQSYIRDLYNKQWRVNVNNEFAKNFNSFLRKIKMNSYSIEDIEYIINDILKNYNNSKYYKLYFDFIKYYIKKRSPTDWYYHGLVFLQNRYNSVIDSINRNSTMRRPKKQSPPRQNQFFNRANNHGPQQYSPTKLSKKISDMSFVPSKLSQRSSNTSFASRGRFPTMREIGSVRPTKGQPLKLNDRFKRY